MIGPARLGLLLGALSLLVGCGASSGSGATATATLVPSTPTPNQTPDIKALGQQYLSIIEPANAALNKFIQQLNAQKSQTVASVQAIATPLADAFQTATNALLRAPWPANVTADIHTEITALAPGINDLGSVSAPLQAWYDRWQREMSIFSSDANVVRSELGLPPPPSATP